MTKYLVKIISICTFVVLMPMIIAGVALSAVGSTMFDVNVYVAYQQKAKANSGARSSVYLYQDGEEKTEQTHNSFMNGSKVNLALDLTGYDFLGWYKGDTETRGDTRVDKENEGTQNTQYTFKVSGKSQYTALLSVKTYQLSFVNIEEGVDVLLNGNPIEKEQINNVYEYGDKLPTLSMKDASDQFKGWSVVGYETATPVEKAEFSVSGTYTLSPVWSARMDVKYYTQKDAEAGQWKNFKTEVYTASGLAEFNFPKVDGEKPDADVLSAIKDGYRFVGWTEVPGGAQVDEATIRGKEFKANTSINLYLKQEAIQYTLNVKKFADSVEPDDVASVAFNADDGFANVGLERYYYTHKGIEFNEVKYYLNEQGEYIAESGESLRNAIYAAAKQNDTVSFDAVAIWECDYDSLAFNYYAEYEDSLSGDSYEIYQGEQHTELPTAYNKATKRLFFIENGQNTVNKMEDVTFDTLICADDSVKYYYFTGGEYVEVKLYGIKILDNLREINKFGTNVLDQVDFGYVLDYLLNDYSKEQVLSKEFSIVFTFKPVSDFIF